MRALNVPFGDRFGGFLQARLPGLMLRLADLESWVRAEEIAATPIRAPIWISGLARSGSTKLLDILARHPALTCHRYSDFAGLFTPWWWNWLRQRSRMGAAPVPVERAHADRILVTERSPEAFEEPLWMAHFRGLHQGARSAVFSADESHPLFERRLRQHIAKLLHVRGASRYLAKANAHLPRLNYLLRVFADARFVVPIRSPLAHVGSLVKQDRLLSAHGQANPAVRRQLMRAGHFEFGLDKRVPQVGDPALVAGAEADFAAGRVAQGYARIWSAGYAQLAQHLRASTQLQAAVCVVRYEALCAQPQAQLQRIIEHIGLVDDHAVTLVQQAAGELSEPDYYRSPLAPAEAAQVLEITAGTAALFGY